MIKIKNFTYWGVNNLYGWAMSQKITCKWI